MTDRERAATEAVRWIKALRHLPVDGVPLRERFTYRGDSLWWFAELYLHKQGVIDQLWRTALALEAAPASPGARRAAAASRFTLDLKSRFYTWSALASRLRPRNMGERRNANRATVRGGTLAFVHPAFWRKPTTARTADEEEGQEGYIGAVLHTLQTRPEARPVRLIGVGPRTNFKARRWWHGIVPPQGAAREIPVEPIERFASWHALAGSRALWRDRFALERALLASDAIRAHATILGYDVWPLIANELRGIARLQFPWSARAMDEAAAALDATRPSLVVTYAEAGGWGRALMLEARRRDIPTAGLQHGFIYRHWLNYLHEPDEMQPSPTNTADRGFPLPDRTLVYDGYAARHLIDAGHFPERAISITGSPALDALTTAVSRIDDAERTRIRQQLDAVAPSRIPAASNPSNPPDARRAAPNDHLIVLVTKFTQVQDDLPALLRAISELPDVRLVIKPHPAETADPYLQFATTFAQHLAGGRTDVPPLNVIVAPPSIDLARLLSVARLLVTVNSTVAIDAIALNVPALIVGLPNNLTPFVEASVMAGAPTHADAATTAAAAAAANAATNADAAPQTNAAADAPNALAATINALIHDEAQRNALLTRARAFAAQHAIHPDGHAADRAADAMLALLQPSNTPRSTPVTPLTSPRSTQAPPV